MLEKKENEKKREIYNGTWKILEFPSQQEHEF